VPCRTLHVTQWNAMEQPDGDAGPPERVGVMRIHQLDIVEIG